MVPLGESGMRPPREDPPVNRTERRTWSLQYMPRMGKKSNKKKKKETRARRVFLCGFRVTAKGEGLFSGIAF
jgi:hypothetical protein